MRANKLVIALVTVLFSLPLAQPTFAESSTASLVFAVTPWEIRLERVTYVPLTANRATRVKPSRKAVVRRKLPLGFNWGVLKVRLVDRSHTNTMFMQSSLDNDGEVTVIAPQRRRNLDEILSIAVGDRASIRSGTATMDAGDDTDVVRLAFDELLLDDLYRREGRESSESWSAVARLRIEFN